MTELSRDRIKEFADLMDSEVLADMSAGIKVPWHRIGTREFERKVSEPEMALFYAHLKKKEVLLIPDLKAYESKRVHDLEVKCNEERYRKLAEEIFETGDRIRNGQVDEHRIADVSRRWAADRGGNKGMFVYGESGSGKTFSCGWAIYQRGIFNQLILTPERLATIKLKQDQSLNWYDLLKFKCICLDDLHFCRDGFQRETLMDFLKWRIDMGRDKLTLFAGIFDGVGGLGEKFGPEISRRILAHCGEFVGEKT